MPSTERLYLRGKIYWCWFYDQNGRPLRRSTKCRDRRAAAAVLARYERRVQGAPEAAADRPAYSVEDAVSAFVVDCRSTNLSPQTIRMYDEKGGQLVRLIGAVDMSDLDVETVKGYIAARVKESPARSTISKELVTLRQALKLAHERGHFVGDVKAVFPKFKVTYVPRERYLTRAEFQRLIVELEPHRQLWLLLAVYTGGRDSEIDALEWGHIDWAQRTILLPGTKTKRSRRLVPLHPLLSKVMAKSRQARGHIVGEWMNVNRDLERACIRARMTKVTPNDLRRTFASWLKQDGVDSAVVARLLGHASTRMVDLVYGQIDPATLARAMNRMPGGECEDSVKDDCSGVGRKRRSRKHGPAQVPVGDSVSAVLGPGIEPGTRGFSIRSSSASDARITRTSRADSKRCEDSVKAVRVRR